MLERVRLAAQVLLSQKEAPFSMVTKLGGPQGALPRLGTRELLIGYSQFPWLRAVVGKIAEIAASVEWYAILTQGEEVAILRAHPLTAFMMDGNEVHNGYALRKLMFVHLLLVGENFWMFERNGAGMPIHPWAVPPSWVKETPVTRDGDFRVRYRFFDARVPGSEMAYFRELDAENPYGRGSGIGAVGGDELQTDEYAAKYIAQFFRNSARPDVVISAKSADKPMKKEHAEAMEESWLAKVQGFWKAHRPLFMAGGPVEITELGRSFAENQMVDLRRFSRDAIMQMYGFPPEGLGVLESSNRATIDAAEFLLTKTVVTPKLISVREFATQRIAPEYDPRLALDFVSPIEEDRAHQLEAMKASPWAYKVDEHRELGLHGPLPDKKGQVHPVPFNLMFSEDLTTGNPPPASDDDASRTVKTTKDAITGPDVDMLLVRLDSGAVRRTVWDTTEHALGIVVDTVGEATLAEVGADLAWQRTNNVQQHLRDWGVKRAKRLDTTTKDALGRRLAEAVTDGDDLAKATARITGYFKEVGPARARMIAQTETTRSAGFATNEALEQAAVPEKMWLETGDSNVRDPHLELGGVTKPRKSEFEVDGARAQHPGDFDVPELDINCRCSLQPILPGTRDFSADERRELWLAKDRDRIPMENAVARAVRRSFRIQSDILVERLAEIMAA